MTDVFWLVLATFRDVFGVSLKTGLISSLFLLFLVIQDQEVYQQFISPLCRSKSKNF